MPGTDYDMEIYLQSHAVAVSEAVPAAMSQVFRCAAYENQVSVR